MMPGPAEPLEIRHRVNTFQVNSLRVHLARRIYSIYSVSLFGLVFLLLLPFFAFFIHTNKRHPMVFWLHRIWAWMYFTFSFIPIKRIYSDKLDFARQYIFCSNHFSYLDIPAIGINKVRPIFVGKHSLGKIPLFGYMYRNIHITLNREKLKSRYDALEKCGAAIDSGHNLVIFPEGYSANRYLGWHPLRKVHSGLL